MNEKGICYSGGASGFDTIFAKRAKSVGHEVVHFVFENYNQSSKEIWKNSYILTQDMLNEADPLLSQIASLIGRKFPTKELYIDNLLRRNYHIIQSSNRVYAVSEMDPFYNIKGGTGWGVAMALLKKKPVYFFCQDHKSWFYSEEIKDKWLMVHQDWIPTPYGCYAGIGTRNPKTSGRLAIGTLYNRNPHKIFD